MSSTPAIEEIDFKAVAPNVILSKLPFNAKKCPLIIAETGNVISLFRYTNAGPFVDLFDPSSSNLLTALKFSIINGRFCIFNFGDVGKIDALSEMLDRLKTKCSTIHKDLYNHIINNTLMKQSFESMMALIPFDGETELVPEIYKNSQETFRMLFLVEIKDFSSMKIQPNDKNLSLFNCMFIKP